MEKERFTQLETERANYCRHSNPGMTAQELSTYYSIDRSVSAIVFGIIDQPKKTKRANYREAALQWATNNLFIEISSQQLAHQIGASLPTTLKIIDSRPDVFRKLGRGKWEIRDAIADRQAEKKDK
jgi:hypothetical protein